MKKRIYLLLLILIIPLNINAETFYTKYKPYLLEQEERIEASDLIKEEEVTYYISLKEERYNLGYYPEGNSFDDKPFIDYNDKIIVSKRETYNQNNNYVRGIVYATDLFLVDEFSITNITKMPKLKIYNTDYNKIDYQIIGNKIILNEAIMIDKLIIHLEANADCKFTINFTNNFKIEVAYIAYSKNLYEINFELSANMIARLNRIGIYTSAFFPKFEYYVYFTYNYLYYNVKEIEVISNDPNSLYINTFSKYNYYKRDIITLNDYVLLNNDNNDYKKIIKSTSLSLDNINFKHNIDNNKNGVYDLEISYQDILVKRPIVVLNEVEVPVCEEKVIYQDVIKEKIIYQDVIKEKIVYQDLIKEKIVYEDKYIEVKPDIVYIDRPIKVNKNICKPEIKYREKECNCTYQPIKDQFSSKKALKVEKKSKQNYAYFIPIFPLIMLVVVIRKKIFQKTTH